MNEVKRRAKDGAVYDAWSSRTVKFVVVSKKSVATRDGVFPTKFHTLVFPPPLEHVGASQIFSYMMIEETVVEILATGSSFKTCVIS